MHSALLKFGYHIEIEKIANHLSRKSTENAKVVFSWHTPEKSYIEFTGEKWWDGLFERSKQFYKYYSIPYESARKIHACFRSQIIDCKNHVLRGNADEILHKCTELGYENYILSNNYPELPTVIKGLGLGKHFKDYIVSANVGYEKPRIELFRYALEAASFPCVCYMIGDNPVADIQGGKAAGMKTILVHSDVDAGADYVCSDLSGIPLLLKQ